jgi:hypothetical protein
LINGEPSFGVNYFYQNGWIYLLILETRTQGTKDIWQTIRNCLAVDPETAKVIIASTGLTMPQNSLTLVIDE